MMVRRRRGYGVALAVLLLLASFPFPLAAQALPAAEACARSLLRSGGMMELQTALAEGGFDPGPIDGVCGAKTVDALRQAQREMGVPPDGIPTPEAVFIASRAARERQAAAPVEVLPVEPLADIEPPLVRHLTGEELRSSIPIDLVCDTTTPPAMVAETFFPIVGCWLAVLYEIDGQQQPYPPLIWKFDADGSFALGTLDEHLAGNPRLTGHWVNGYMTVLYPFLFGEFPRDKQGTLIYYPALGTEPERGGNRVWIHQFTERHSYGNENNVILLRTAIGDDLRGTGPTDGFNERHSLYLVRLLGAHLVEDMDQEQIAGIPAIIQGLAWTARAFCTRYPHICLTLPTGGVILQQQPEVETVRKAVNAINDEQGIDAPEVKPLPSETATPPPDWEPESDSRWANAKARETAESLGYQEARGAPFQSRGQLTFKRGNRWITPDVDGHRGNLAWKMFDNKGRRLGTFSSDLGTKLGP